MQSRAKILVLHHENQPRETEAHYLVSPMGAMWSSWGCAVRHQFGVAQEADADIVIVHVDLSVVPDEYLEYALKFPCRVNVGLTDIRKSRISRNLVTLDDDFLGPVIVKTDLNHGGTPEVRLGIRAARSPGLLDRVKGRLGLRNPLLMNGPHDYCVYERKADVPRAVFDDPSLVVERFLGESATSGFLHRRYLFFGDVEINQSWSGRNAVNHGDHAQEELPTGEVPEELRRLRAELKADFGKIDYAIVDGEAQAFDVNRTPSGWVDDPIEEDALWAREVSSTLARGLEKWL
ncbi:MAG: hypothetical protein ACYSWX_08615 [Planctomycetota bacterium]|jgi:hypothetical protein